MLEGRKTHILSWSAAITALIGLATRFLIGEIGVAEVLSEAYTVFVPLAISAFRAAKASVPAPTPLHGQTP